ncbi:MAG: RluA family pseudouridine synthase [Proteobacteria bacterium]|nr:RluA family pseudouridine synthase [Pseudomonadota bacterium]
MRPTIRSDEPAARFRVSPGEAGRADQVVKARFPGIGRRRVAELFRRGAVHIDGRRAKKGEPVASGSEMVVLEAPRDHRAAVPPPNYDLDLTVLYEDRDVVAVNKPGGLPCHPLRPEERNTVAHALVARYPECASTAGDAREAGLVNRLDIGTSGILVAARHAEAWRVLRQSFSRGQAIKMYWALVGTTAVRATTCDLPLTSAGKRMTVLARAGARTQSAWTRWRPARHLAGYTLLACITHTGRRHQVRVHLAQAGLPIVDDVLYRGPSAPLPIAGHFLHARSIALAHPISGARLHLVAPLLADRQALLDSLG